MDREPILLWDEETGTYHYAGHLHGQLQCLGCWQWFSANELTQDGLCAECEEAGFDTTDYGAVPEIGLK